MIVIITLKVCDLFTSFVCVLCGHLKHRIEVVGFCKMTMCLFACRCLLFSP